MTNILDTIISRKQVEVKESKQRCSITSLEEMPLFLRETLSLKASLLDKSKSGIIAEYKRQSPSKGIINDRSAIVDVTSAYTQFGASGISVLTDTDFFGGSLEDLVEARINNIPLLRKDFIIDEYQLIEAKAHGADVILLIAACLSPAEVKRLAAFAKSLHLEVLLELHEESELEHVCDEVDLVGVNNRNLKTFAVDLEHSIKMASKIDDRFIKIAESGINETKAIHYLKQHGFSGFLIGENFMRTEDPGAAFKAFVEEINAS
ncbi:MAG: trpC [Flaviaesturariibacter sp.]|nr:trpC [Flaviaesturariibacter sp.]